MQSSKTSTKICAKDMGILVPIILLDLFDDLFSSIQFKSNFSTEIQANLYQACLISLLERV